MSKNRKIVYLAGFLFSLPLALAAYINSSFISSLIGEQSSGFIYTLGSIGSILALLLSPKIFQAVGVRKFLISSVFLGALTFLVIATVNVKWIILPTFVLGFSLNTLVIFALDELLEIFSRDKSTGGTRGAYIAICSLGWIIAQLVSGTIIDNTNFERVYLLSFFIMVVLLVLIVRSFKNIIEPKYDKIANIGYVTEFFKNENLARAYSMNFLLQTFFCFMIIYTPMYLSTHLHFTWTEIGQIFAVMLLPFLILPFPLGKYSDKIGERKILLFGFSITALATLSLFFITRHEVWIWAIALFVTRIGASAIEAMSDAYFFKHIRSEAEEFVGIYRSAPPLAYTLGPILAFIIFYLTPSFEFIYLALGALMFYGVYLASQIEKNDI